MRCCDCEFRKECRSTKNDLTGFASCRLRESYLAKYKVVETTLKEFPGYATVCEVNGISGKCGLDCSAFDGRICGG